MKRCFISIELPEEIKKEIKKIQEKLPFFIGKKTESKNLHLTIKFLGEIDEEKIEEIREKLREIDFNEIKCEVDSIGVFSEHFVRIIWIHLNGCDELQKSIDNFLEKLFEKEERFMSHITIARIKLIKDKKKFLEDLKKIKLEKVKLEINEFCLMESILKPEGPEYKVVERFNTREI
ncbi:MAG: RNA 2',3'-cyclic phosphodiesterase [Candidatus Pacearchaeota archaeon]